MHTGTSRPSILTPIAEKLSEIEQNGIKAVGLFWTWTGWLVTLWSFSDSWTKFVLIKITFFSCGSNSGNGSVGQSVSQSSRMIGNDNSKQ